jgi:hypothetical protein
MRFIRTVGISLATYDMLVPATEAGHSRQGPDLPFFLPPVVVQVPQHRSLGVIAIAIAVVIPALWPTANLFDLHDADSLSICCLDYMG